MTIATARTAVTDAPILDVLAERWSTRIFDRSAPIDEAALASALEAARWSPSANNTQPWRFIVARRGSKAFAAIYEALRDFNKSWAGDAGVLLVAVAQTATDDGSTMHFGQYDTGQAVAHFTVQAHAGGLSTHQMGGFDRAAVKAGVRPARQLRPAHGDRRRRPRRPRRRLRGRPRPRGRSSYAPERGRLRTRQRLSSARPRERHRQQARPLTATGVRAVGGAVPTIPGAASLHADSTRSSGAKTRIVSHVAR